MEVHPMATCSQTLRIADHKKPGGDAVAAHARSGGGGGDGVEVHPRRRVPLPAAPVPVLRLRGHGHADADHGRLHLRARARRRVLPLQPRRAAHLLRGAPLALGLASQGCRAYADKSSYVWCCGSGRMLCRARHRAASLRSSWSECIRPARAGALLAVERSWRTQVPASGQATLQASQAASLMFHVTSQCG